MKFTKQLTKKKLERVEDEKCNEVYVGTLTRNENKPLNIFIKLEHFQ